MEGDKEIPVYSISPKIPSFYQNDVENWLAVVKNQFKLAKITTESTKFSHIIANLPASATGKVKQIMIKEFQVGDLAKLESALVSQYGLSKAQRMQIIFESGEMGDQKPSEFYYDLVSKASGLDISEEVLLNRFLSRIPGQLQPLATSLKASTFSTEFFMNALDEVFESFQKQQMTANVAAVTHSHRPPPRRNQNVESSGLCWYHETFGNRSYKCQPGCSWRPRIKNDRR